MNWYVPLMITFVIVCLLFYVLSSCFLIVLTRHKRCSMLLFRVLSCWCLPYLVFFLKISSGIKKHEFHLFGKGHLHTSIEKINNKCIFKLLLVPGGYFCFRHRCIFYKNFVFKMSLDKPLLKEIIITTFNLLLMYLTCQVR